MSERIILQKIKEADVFKPASPEEIEKRKGPGWEGIKHEYECQVCGKPATYNLQRMWHRWDITPNGDFTNEKEWEGDVNEWYCDEHAEKEGIV